MEDLQHLRDEYEKALDEAESKRAAYYAAVRRHTMMGASPDKLISFTGLSGSRVRALLGRPQRRRLLIASVFIFLFTVETIGLVVYRWPPSQISGSATFSFEKGSDVREADLLLQQLERDFVIRDAQVHEEGEQLRYQGHSVSRNKTGELIVHESDPIKVRVPLHVTVESPLNR